MVLNIILCHLGLFRSHGLDPRIWNKKEGDSCCGGQVRSVELMPIARYDLHCSSAGIQQPEQWPLKKQCGQPHLPHCVHYLCCTLYVALSLYNGPLHPALTAPQRSRGKNTEGQPMKFYSFSDKCYNGHNVHRRQWRLGEFRWPPASASAPHENAQIFLTYYGWIDRWMDNIHWICIWGVFKSKFIGFYY